MEAAEREVLLFASREEGESSYCGTALLGEAMPDPVNARMYLLPLHNQQSLARAITLKELHALGVAEMPFDIYHLPDPQGWGGRAVGFGEHRRHT